jgi:hypothetical protein
MKFCLYDLSSKTLTSVVPVSPRPSSFMLRTAVCSLCHYTGCKEKNPRTAWDLKMMEATEAKQPASRAQETGRVAAAHDVGAFC